MNTSAHTSPPKLPKAASRVPAAAGAAGVAAAVASLAWFLAPEAPKRAASAPEAPAAAPALAMPERPVRAPAPKAAEVRLRAEATAAIPASRARLESERPPESARKEAAERPAWTRAKHSQTWTWPARVGLRQAEGSIGRKLIGWFPANAPNKAFQYQLTVDRAETRIFEDEIPEFAARIEAEDARRAGGAAAAPPGFIAAVIDPSSAEFEALIRETRALELAHLQSAKRAVSSRDVSNGGAPMAELTYADGRKETIPYDPLVFDLKGDGVKTTNGKVLFDLYGHGTHDKTQWMSDLDAGAGILVFDATGSGSSGKNGSEVFGDRTDLTGVGRPTGFANGFEALQGLAVKAVDENVLGREVLDSGILDAAALAALEKAYGLKMKVGGFNRNPISLVAAGVDSIALSGEPTQRAVDFDGRRNDLLVQPGAVFRRRDGSTGAYMNVWLVAQRGNLGLKTADPVK